MIWHCPTLEGPCGPTTIGADGLNCRVRDGNGWNPAAIGARNFTGITMNHVHGDHQKICMEKNFQCQVTTYLMKNPGD